MLEWAIELRAMRYVLNHRRKVSRWLTMQPKAGWIQVSWREASCAYLHAIALLVVVRCGLAVAGDVERIDIISKSDLKKIFALSESEWEAQGSALTAEMARRDARGAVVGRGVLSLGDGSLRLSFRPEYVGDASRPSALVMTGFQLMKGDEALLSSLADRAVSDGKQWLAPEFDAVGTAMPTDMGIEYFFLVWPKAVVERN
jgi:hypothetical protein